MGNKPVPNICESTQVSYDFKLAFGSLNNYLERVEEGDDSRTRHLAKRAFLHREILCYEDYFGSEVFQDVITAKNKDTVNKINLVVAEINERRKLQVVEYDELVELRDRLVKLVCG